MIKREVIMPDELIEEITEIVHKESYTALKDAFPAEVVRSPVFINQLEAEALIVLAVIEKKKSWLMYPHDEDDPNYDKGHEVMFDDIQMGIYKKTIYYVQSAFIKGEFNHLIS